MNKKRVYEENIERISDFYESDYCATLLSNGNTDLVRDIIEVLYVDPDRYDYLILEKVKEYKEKYKVDFSGDGICGWKLLYDVYGPQEWLKKYEIIRKSDFGTLYWPLPKVRGMGINTLRSALYGDRIDYTLYDLKAIIEKAERKEPRINPDGSTKAFLNLFDFSGFIEEFNMGLFVNKQNHKILNLETGIELETNDYKWSNRYGAIKKRKLMKVYLDNLIDLLS